MRPVGIPYFKPSPPRGSGATRCHRGGLLFPGALAVLLVLALAVPAAALAVRAPVIVAAQPTPDVGDGRDAAGTFRVTVTPNHDGRNDRMVVDACAPAAARPWLYGWNQRQYWWNDVRVRPLLSFASAACPAPLKRFRFRWNATHHQGGRPHTSYLFAVCSGSGGRTRSLATPRCSRTKVVAHVTKGYAGRTLATAVAPGESLGLRQFFDHDGVVAGFYRDTAMATGHGLLAGPWRVRDGHTITTIRVPAGIPPGRYQVIYTEHGHQLTAVPVVVTGTDWDTVAGPVPEHRALVVWPTNTWTAYDHIDGDRDGSPDSWYVNGGSGRDVALAPGYEVGNDQPDWRFNVGLTEWLATRHPGQYTAVGDRELATMDPAVLGQYAAVVFAGHEEYYEPAVLDLLKAYRDAGGNVLMLSTNNEYRRVSIVGDVVHLEDYGYVTQHEYTLAGVGLRACAVAPEDSFMLRLTASALDPGAPSHWLLDGTSLTQGSAVSLASGEVDGMDPAYSPPSGVDVVATTGTVPDTMWGCRRHPITADLTVARIGPGPGSGEVLSVGTMGFLQPLGPGGDPRERAQVEELLENAWSHYVGSGPGAPDLRTAPSARTEAYHDASWRFVGPLLRARLAAIDPDAVLRAARRAMRARRGGRALAGHVALLARIRAGDFAVLEDDTMPLRPEADDDEGIDPVRLIAHSLRR